jgi:PPOX class probable F420-dependent enzyme
LERRATAFEPDKHKGGDGNRNVNGRLNAPTGVQYLGTYACCTTSRSLMEHPMAAIPEQFMDLMTGKKAFAHLATIMRDGTPQVTPVWFDYTNGAVRVNTAKGRVKARNMNEGAAVALSILDPDNPYRYLQIRGRVRRVTEEGAAAHIDSLAKKYLDKDKYPFAQPGEIRVTYEIEPRAVQVMG